MTDIPQARVPEVGAATPAPAALTVDLRIGQVEVFHTLAVDLAPELLSDRERDWRILQRARAADSGRGSLHAALGERVRGCVDEAEGFIRPRMRESVRLRGKAVWTEQFLERFAPVRLPPPRAFRHNQTRIGRDSRLSDDRGSPLHHVRFRDAELKLFPEGTLTYTVRTTFDNTSHGRVEPNLPASIPETIMQLDRMDDLLIGNFRAALSELFNVPGFREAVRASIHDGSGPPDAGLELVDFSTVDDSQLKRMSKEHRTMFVERFFDGRKLADPNRTTEAEISAAEVDLATVRSSAAPAGLLNTASWYDNYSTRYVTSLAEQEIGYRKDELYLTDRKATLVCAAGVWREEDRSGTSADPLTRYKWDLVLAVEYNLARLAYLSSTLAYYQTHPDVQRLETIPPLKALGHVIDGWSALAHIDESLDLSLSVDHGFTRLFTRRLREELDIDGAIGFVRNRVKAASTSVGLNSAVRSAEDTSKENLVAARRSLDAANENIRLQRRLLVIAIVAVVITVLASSISPFVQWRLEPKREFIVCVTPSGEREECSEHPSR
jgi:hypothetical protein